MRTLRPGQQVKVFVEREGDYWWLLIRVAGAVYRQAVARADLEALELYLHTELERDKGGA